MSLTTRLASFALATVLLAPGIAAATDTYTSATFSGGVSSVQPQLAGVYTSGSLFNGSFVFDDALVPAAGSGTVNVTFTNFPEIAQIPSSSAFYLDFLPPFEFADNFGPPAAIQYLNGQFNGFQFTGNFLLGPDDDAYQLRIDGAALTIRARSGDDPTGDALLTGFINVGNGALSGQAPFTLSPVDPGPGGGGTEYGVPEPATWALLIMGLGGVGAAMRRRRDTMRGPFASHPTV